MLSDEILNKMLKERATFEDFWANEIKVYNFKKEDVEGIKENPDFPGTIDLVTNFVEYARTLPKEKTWYVELNYSIFYSINQIKWFVDYLRVFGFKVKWIIDENSFSCHHILKIAYIS